MLGGAVAAPLHWLGRAQASTFQDAPLPPEAELYGGFILLPEGAPVSPWVKPYRLPPPDECGVGTRPSGHRSYAVTKFFSAVEELAKDVDFPVYTPGNIPGLRQASAFVVSHETGEVYGASLGFETYNSESGDWVCTVSLWAQPDFARPFPLWSSLSTEHKDRAIVLEKVDYLPSAGIKVKTQLGYVFLWIEDNILYTLVVEHSKSLEAAQGLISSLVKIG